jgi:hypothetical protein
VDRPKAVISQALFFDLATRNPEQKAKRQRRQRLKSFWCQANLPAPRLLTFDRRAAISLYAFDKDDATAAKIRVVLSDTDAL